MKHIYHIAAIVVAILLSSCVDLDLNPLAKGSSENWYSSAEELEMSVNDFYREEFFPIFDSLWGLETVNRNNLQPIEKSSLTSTSSTIKKWWSNYYKGIGRAHRLLKKIENAREMGLPESTIQQYQGEAYFYLGFAYGMLAFYWGDVILDKTGMTLEEAYSATRSPKKEVVAYAYECLDKAADYLPLSYSGTQRATKGAALGMKARIALFHEDWRVSAESAKKCMDLGVYELYDNYEKLFLTDWTKEGIFTFVGDYSQDLTYYIATRGRNHASRTAGGLGSCYPSHELVCLYTCTDGLPIDESPLYNPKSPFDNRDPRMAMTIVPFATPYTPCVLEGKYDPKDYAWLGYEYTPAPTRYTCVRISDGKEVTNGDSKARGEHSSYNGFLLKKYINPAWEADRWYGGGPFYYLRYADVLLMYAEAMNEMGLCTQEVLDKTINPIRERAYRQSGLQYPRVTEADQTSLRTLIRTERQVELAVENRSVDDLFRWRVAEKYYNTPVYYLDRTWSGKATWTGDESQVSATYRKMIQNWRDGNYPIGGVPEIDENGIADISSMYEKGYLVKGSQRKFNKDRDYLFPIPADDIAINQNLTQNPNY